MISGFGANKLNLKSITLDMEVALRTSIATVFGKIDFIPCLFHIKQAWYRQAQSLGLTCKNKVEQTMDIIKEYGQICCLDISKMDQTFTRLNN